MAFPTPLTEYAQKYGRLGTGHNSGLTPIPPLFPSLTTAQPEQVWADRRHTQYQRTMLNGFTTQELIDLDAISTRKLQPGNLSNGIHPLFRRWETHPPQSFPRYDLYKLQSGEGDWIMGNPVVKGIMEPILRLATRIICSEHVLPWFAALLVGERVPIPEHRIRDIDKSTELRDMVSFHPVPNFDPSMMAKLRDQVFQTLFNKFGYQLGFQSVNEDPTDPSNADFSPDSNYAMTILNTEEMNSEFRPPGAMWQVFTFITLDYAEALFRSDLTDAERMGTQYAIANTIAHEVMHACFFAVSDIRGESLETEEPYYQDEPMPEMGFSFEMAINGGVIEPFTGGAGPPLGYWIDTVWPSINNRNGGNQRPNLQNPGLKMQTRTYPIPVSVYTDIQQTAFWEVAHTKFGNAVVHYRTLYIGCLKRWFIRPIADADLGGTDQLMEGELTHDTEIIRHYPSINEHCRLISAYTTRNKRDRMMLSPAGRVLVQFGEDFVAGSAAERGYWANARSQLRIVNSVNASISKYLQSPAEDLEKTFGVLLDALRDVRENHEAMVVATNKLGLLGRSKYLDRIKQLLDWNRNTQYLTYQIASAAKMAGNQSLVDMLTPEIIGFERCRLKLWYPTSGIQDTPEAAEIQQLHHIRIAALGGRSHASYVKMDSLCMLMIADEKIPLVPSTCARMCYELLHYLDGTDLKARYERIQLYLTIVRACREGAPFGWLLFLNEWTQFGKDALSAIQSLQQPQ